MYSKDLVKLLLKDGWQIVSQNGSHLKLKKKEKTEIVPMHNKELKKGTLETILKRTGLK